jgi:protein ImuA
LALENCFFIQYSWAMFDLLDAPDELAETAAAPLKPGGEALGGEACDDAALADLLRERPQWFWRASDLAAGSSNGLGVQGSVSAHACPSPWPELNAQLPGGGWPQRCVIDLLQAQAGTLEWRLLGASLAQHLARHKGQLMLVNPPLIPYAPGLATLGIEAQRIVGVGVRPLRGPNAPALTPRQALWATEQALQCAGLAAVLAWLPQAQAAQLRRLHSHAAAFDGMCFVLRPASAQHQSCAAPLRVLAQLAEPGAEPRVEHGTEAMLASTNIQLHLLKRRGPPLAQTLLLPAWPQALAFGPAAVSALGQTAVSALGSGSALAHAEAATSSPAPLKKPPTNLPPTTATPTTSTPHAAPVRRAVRGSRRAPFADMAANLAAGAVSAKHAG